MTDFPCMAKNPLKLVKIDDADILIPDVRRLFENFNYDLIMMVLDYFAGSKTETAKFLGIKRTALVQYLKRKAPGRILAKSGRPKSKK